MALSVDWRLYLLLDTGLLAGRDPLVLARSALVGGVTVVQLRAKEWPAGRVYALANALVPLTRDHGVAFLVNDCADIALAAGADGVHLGVDDLPVAAARRLMPDGLIGYSPEGAADARRAVADGATYLGVGPFAATQTKPDAGPAIHATGLSDIVTAVTVPVVAIGGLTVANVGAALAAGAAGVVIGSAILGAADPEAAARQVRRLVDAAIDQRAALEKEED
ncbi:MAG: thiamine phosphate synthase [Chloroflexi bacterium]|nr:thiamine phosphate synthase [Chloroflexota bacterium]